MDGLYFHMDHKLEILFPPLKRAVHLLTSLKKSPQESHIQYLERVTFTLSWDKLIIILLIKGLSKVDQCKILRHFDTFDISIDN